MFDVFSERTGFRLMGATDRKQVLQYWDPHYTNPIFRDGDQTIFGEERDGICYDYSDRIVQWDYKKADEAATVANQYETPRTAAWVELYLSYFYGEDCTVHHIVAGVNRSNGYPYRAYGYTMKEAQQ